MRLCSVDGGLSAERASAAQALGDLGAPVAGGCRRPAARCSPRARRCPGSRRRWRTCRGEGHAARGPVAPMPGLVTSMAFGPVDTQVGGVHGFFPIAAGRRRRRRAWWPGAQEHRADGGAEGPAVPARVRAGQPSSSPISRVASMPGRRGQCTRNSSPPQRARRLAAAAPPQDGRRELLDDLIATGAPAGRWTCLEVIDVDQHPQAEGAASPLS